jgi:23S rRNA-/tRNA-specific pseudouridylate synthase
MLSGSMGIIKPSTCKLWLHVQHIHKAWHRLPACKFVVASACLHEYGLTVAVQPRGMLIRHRKRIFSVGRLDKDSTSIVLLTNDGRAVNALLRAQHGHSKRYAVEVNARIDDGTCRRWHRAWRSQRRRSAMAAERASS